jgi:pimeloyl-ACP methyl ester carboxylesterase/DNA-binding CsgD family transcriptional regulator
MQQRVSFCEAADGVRLAYAVHGRGPPLVKAANWLTQIDHDWDSPVWRHWLHRLGEHHTVVRYDERGSGLSDRDPPEVSLHAWIGDLEVVVDAAGYDEFCLFGMCEGGMVAVAYAARHPHRVRRLVLYGSYARGRLRREATPRAHDEAEALVALTRVGWDQPNRAYRRLFTDLVLPEGTAEQRAWFDELQRLTSSPEHAAQCRRVRYAEDVTALAREVTAPTLVLHPRDDAVVPFEEARVLASLIPNAELVPLPSANHILLADEPGFDELTDRLRGFLAPDEPVHPAGGTADPLSPRELDVLALVAAGMTNDEIADKLFISVRTVERHLSNLYHKLGATGRAARAAAAAWYSRHHADR